jgi:Cys-tRNA(Pro)/Cys-tRNA(Cys) deacylase
MLGPLDIHQHLLAHDVRHEIMRVRRTAPTAAHLPEALEVAPGHCVLAHLFVVSGDPAATPDSAEPKLVLLMATAGVDASDPALISSIESFLGSGGATGPIRRLRRPRKAPRISTPVTATAAPAELVSSRTDYLASHLAPMLLPAEVLVVATPELADLGAEIVYTATGDGGTALALRAADLLDITRSRLLDPPVDARVIDLDRAASRPANRSADTPSDTRGTARRSVLLRPARSADPVVLPARKRVPEGTT